MRHWSERYLELAYDAERFDCAHLVEKVLREQFKRELALPKEHPTNYRDQAAAIEAHKGDYATRTTEPREGDGVLIVSRGHFDHLGVYCLIQGEPWVLHNSRRFGRVCLTRIRELPAQLLAVEGYYRWI